MLVNKVNLSKNNVARQKCQNQIPFRQKTDSFVLSKDNNKNLSVTKKVGIGLGGVFAVGISALSALFFIKPSKFKPANFKEFIEFKPAQTMEEAKEFALKNFGIKKFELEDDTELANWINEGLTNINNRFKGKAHMPKSVGFDPNLEEDKLGVLTWGYDFRLSKNAYNKEACIEEIQTTFDDFGINLDERTFAILPGLDSDKLKKSLELYRDMISNPNNYSRVEFATFKMRLMDAYANVYDPMRGLTNIANDKNAREVLEKENISISLVDLFDKSMEEQLDVLLKAFNVLIENDVDVLWAQGSDRVLSKFDLIYHEMGHLQHFKNTTKFSQYFGKLGGGEIQLEKFTKDFQKQQTAGKVSWYAKINPIEFVAETFSQMVNGKKMPDDVIGLYEYYGGYNLSGVFAGM